MAVAQALSDRVKETSTTTGTGNFTLAGASAANYSPFSAAFAVGQRFPYVIESATEVEIGVGYLSDATTLVRETISGSSSGGGVTHSFAAGAKTVFCTPLAVFLSSPTRGRMLATSTNQILFR